METHHFTMRWTISVAALVLASGCGVSTQPESIQTTDAFEVPLPSQTERERFLSLLHEVAEDHAMHVDAETQEELKRRANVSAQFSRTMSAAVWKSSNDDEPIASAMDSHDHLCQVWLTFSKGEDPALNSKFRDALVSEVMRSWPDTLSLPIMPTGAIPLHRDLIRTADGYVVNPTEAYKYELR